MNAVTPRRIFSLRLKIFLAMGVVAVTVMAAFIVPGVVLRQQGVVGEFQTFVRSAAGTAALAPESVRRCARRNRFLSKTSSRP